MKKKTLFTAICFALASFAFAQLSISIDNKYGFKMPGSYAQLYYGAGSGYGYGNSTYNGSATTIESKKYNFGAGYQGGINLRYGFKGGIGIDLGLGYLLGLKDQTKDESSTNNPPYYSSSSTGKTYYKTQMGRLNLGISYIGEGKVSPLIKMGGVLGKGKIDFHSESSQVQTSTQYSYNPNPPYNTYTVTTTTSHTYEDDAKFYGGISIGFYSSVGISYKVNDNLGLMLCLDVVVQDYSPKKYIRTKSIQDGVDQIPKMKKSEKEVEFVKNYTDVGGQPNDLVPSQYPKLSIPLSSFGPSFSISYTFGKKNGSVNSETKQQ